MTNNFELVIFSPSDEEVTRLTRWFHQIPGIQIVQGNGVQVSSQINLDALWVHGMAITYMGFDPFWTSSALVAPMPQDRREVGLPPLVVAGMLHQRDVVAPDQMSSQLLSLLLRAVELHNACAKDIVRRVGALSDYLGLTMPHAEENVSGFVETFLKETAGAEARLHSEHHHMAA